jgi:hypothetical protein
MMVLRFTETRFRQQLSGWISRGLALQAGAKRGFGLWCGARGLIEVEFQNPGDHQHGLWPAPIFKQGKSQRCGSIYKQTPTQSGLVSNNPVATAIPADHEHVVLRGRFNILAHGTSPAMSNTNLVDARHVVNVRCWA